MHSYGKSCILMSNPSLHCPKVCARPLVLYTSKQILTWRKKLFFTSFIPLLFTVSTLLYLLSFYAFNDGMYSTNMVPRLLSTTPGSRRHGQTSGQVPIVVSLLPHHLPLLPLLPLTTTTPTPPPPTVWSLMSSNLKPGLQAPEILPRPYWIFYTLTGDFQCESMEIFQIVGLDI